MAGNPSKDVMRQPLPQGGDQAAPQDLFNQSFDPVFRTLVFQLWARDAAGTNMYPLVADSSGALSIQGNPTRGYSLVQLDDTSSVTYEYYAYMDKDSNWYIKRLTTATNLFEFTAPVATSYTTGWTNRASLTYLTYGGAF